jgi:hypothetical protein
MTTNKALHSRIVFEQIILEKFVQGCTYAAIAWMRRSSDPPAGAEACYLSIAYINQNRAMPGLIKVQIR